MVDLKTFIDLDLMKDRAPKRDPEEAEDAYYFALSEVLELRGPSFIGTPTELLRWQMLISPAPSPEMQRLAKGVVEGKPDQEAIEDWARRLSNDLSAHDD